MIHLNGYTGAMSFNSMPLPTGVATQNLSVVLNLNHYALTFGDSAPLKFDVDKDGNVTSQNAGAAHRSLTDPNHLDLHTVTVTIQRNGYDGYLGVPQYAVSNTSGDAKFVLITGLSNYAVRIGTNAQFSFDLDSTGHTISRNTAAADAFLATLSLKTAVVQIDPRNYPGAFILDGTNPANRRTSHTLVRNIDQYVVGLGGALKASFKVNADGTVATSDPGALSASGNTLTFRTSYLVVDPKTYRGSFWLQDLYPSPVIGPNAYVLLAGLGPYHLVGPKGSIGTFGLDATGRPSPSSLITTIDGRRVTFALYSATAPTIVPIGAKVVREGSRLAFSIAASGMPGRALEFGLMPGAPVGASINSKTGQFSFTPTNGDVVYLVIVRVMDKAVPSLNAFASFLIRVDNVAPALRISGPGAAVPGQPVTFTFTATDASVVDQRATFTYEIDWDGDGHIDQFVTGRKQITVKHVFPFAGKLFVKATVQDKDGGRSALVGRAIQIIPVMLQADPVFPNVTNLVIGGTTSNDRIRIDRMGDLGFRVTINGVSYGVFRPSGRLIFFGQGGDDSMETSDLRLKAWMNGIPFLRVFGRLA